VTLKSELEVTQDHSNWYHSKAWVRFPIRLPIQNDCYVIIVIIQMPVSMVLSSWQSHCESSPGSFERRQSAADPQTKPNDWDCKSACLICQSVHPPSPFIIITQPKSYYLFYRPTENGRLSRPDWLVTYQDGLPVHRRSPILVLTWSDVDRSQRITTKPNRQPRLMLHVSNI